MLGQIFRVALAATGLIVACPAWGITQAAIREPASTAAAAPDVGGARDGCPDKVARLALTALDGVPRTLHSHGAAQRAARLQSTLHQAQAYLSRQLPTAVEYTLAVADADAWKRGCHPVPYGLPHMHPDGMFIFLAADPDNAASAAYASIAAQLPPSIRARIERTTPFAQAAQDFVDLIGLHELGHVYADAAGLHRDRHWLGEFIASYLAYDYLVAAEPQSAALWRDMNLAFSSGPPPTHTSLEDFNRLYDGMPPQNYGWYQGRFQRRVEEVHARMGIAFVHALAALAQDDVQDHTNLLARLDAIAPGFGAWAEQMRTIGDTAPADLVLFNGRLFTADPQRPWASALAIRGERIVAVGDDDTMLAMAGERSRRIDLQGHLAIPGINDAHEHLAIWPQTTWLDAGAYNPPWTAMRTAITQAGSTSHAGTFLAGTIGSKIFHDAAIDRDALDLAAPEHPAFLGTFVGHAGVFSSKALDRLGVGEDIADPLGGRYERNAHGRLTGVLRQYANFDAWLRFGALASDDAAIAQLRQQLEERARLGITTTQTMPITADAARMASLLARARTPIRVRVVPFNATTPEGRAPYADVPHPAPSPLVVVSGQKWVLDGVLLEGSLTPRDAAHAHAHDPHGPYGPGGLPPLFPQQQIEAILRESLARDEQLLVHVFGRPAAAAVLDAMEATGGAGVWASRRMRFEHADGLLEDLWPRAKALGVVVSQQGSHLDGTPFDDPAFVQRFREGKGQPLRSLLDVGIPLALGSDGPPSPYLGIMLASLHPNRPEEAITREEALLAYTLGSAYAEFSERDKGSLEAGKLADIAVLSQDIFAAAAEALPATRSLLTLVGGQVAWADEAFAQPPPQDVP